MNRNEILADIAADRIGVTDQGVWWCAAGNLSLLQMAWIESVLNRRQAVLSDRYTDTPLGRARLLTTTGIIPTQVPA